MKRTYRNIAFGFAYGYVGFVVVNTAVAYFTSNFRTGRNPGDNKLLDFNDWLTHFNPLARFVIPVAGIPVTASNPAIPTGATVTTTPIGTTTTFSALPVPFG